MITTSIPSIRSFWIETITVGYLLVTAWISGPEMPSDFRMERDDDPPINSLPRIGLGASGRRVNWSGSGPCLLLPD